jgi:hypothetical protein
MIKRIKKAMVVGTILLLASILCYGCSSASSNKAVIDRQFLYDIEKAFKQEAKSGKDQNEIYNKIWEQNYYELIYLATIGDEKATDVSISLIGQKNGPAELFQKIELLVNASYEADYKYFWKALAKKPVDVQLRVIHFGERYEPIDWCPVDCYLNNKPEIKKLYEEKYGLVKNHDE